MMDNSVNRPKLLLILLLLSTIGNTTSTRTWSFTIVVSQKGSLTQTCGSMSTPCTSLDVALKKAERQGFNDTRILLKQGLYKLENHFSLSFVRNFAIFGEDQAEVICKQDVGIAFAFSDGIGLYNVKFRNCGGRQRSLIGYDKSTGIMQYLDYFSALYFSYCTNLEIHNVEVRGSDGVGVTFTDVSGSVNVTNSLFKDNTPRHDETPSITHGKREAHAGGGVFLLLNSYGYNPLNISKEEHEQFQHDGKFIFRNIQFLGNEARNQDIDDEINSPLTPFSRGGGLGIYLFGNASGNTFTLSRCTFVNNHAQWGGGLQAEFKHNTENNRIEVVNSTFLDNHAEFAGGAARFGDITMATTAIKPNRFIVTDCQFRNNTSIWGGAVSIYGTTFVEHVTSQIWPREKFVIINSVFSENKGNVGSALGVFLFNLNVDNIGPLVPIHVVLENCSIINNDVMTTNYDVLIGQGALYTVEVPIISRGYLTITNNSQTSMVLDSAIFVVYGRVHFSHNTGHRGGAIALYGNSKIRLTHKSKLFFINNECREKGGAVYVDAPGSPQVSFNATGYATHQCFFEYIDKYLDFDLWDTEIVFQGNSGPNEESGLSLYATSLQNCRRVGETRRNNTVLQWKVITFLERDGLNYSNINKEVSTDPIDVEFRKEDWYVTPSEIFNVSLTLLDEIGNPVNGMVSIDIRPRKQTSRVRLATPSSLFLVHQNQVPSLSLKGRGGEEFDVVLRSIGRYLLEETISNITLKDCNHGYHSSNDKCVCSDVKLAGVSRCGEDGKKVFLKRGFWAGVLKDKSFHTVPCPVNYCKCPDPFRENAIGECTYVQRKMCDGDRDDDSILCGKCKPGYTASFGTESCIVNCSTSHIAYFLLIGLALIVLVMILMTINVDVFTGYLNAWLYSYQVISLLVPGTFEFDNFMEFIIGLSKLQLRIGETGTCFSQGLDEVDKLAIMYILPGFVLFLVCVISKLVKRFPKWRYSQYVRAPFSAFSTIFVLCYTNITGISLKILNPVPIQGKVRVFAQGDLEIFHGKHLAYGLLAIFNIIFIVALIPILLIFQPWIAKCFRRVNVNLQNLKPLFDKLQGCFKDEYRWCAAFYFISRLLILVFETFIPQSPLKRALLEASCVTILVTFVWLRPYKEATPGAPGAAGQTTDYSWINVSDAVLLTNLTLVTIFSSAIDDSSDHRRQGIEILVNILAYVPLVVLGFVLYRSYRQYSKNIRAGQTKCEFPFKNARHRNADRVETEGGSSSDIHSTVYTVDRMSATDY